MCIGVFVLFAVYKEIQLVTVNYNIDADELEMIIEICVVTDISR